MADPLYSAGARAERRAHQERLRRQVRYFERMLKSGTVSSSNLDGAISALKTELAWNAKRVSRYSKRPGGLGK